MADKDLIFNNFLDNEFSVVFNQNENKKMKPEYFLANYKTLLKRYLSNGKPSKDTENSYYSAIDQFIFWCNRLKLDIFKINEQHILYYRSFLIDKNYKAASVKFKLTALRRFYFVAIKYKLITENPVLDVHAQRDPDAYIPVLKFLTSNQLQQILNSISEDNEKDLRTKTIIALMAIEGLRTIEVYRMNIQDINFELKTIYIRGKGHNDMIYPSLPVMKLLFKYVNCRNSDHSYPTPVFTSTSNRSRGKRLSRQKIRESIDKVLKDNGFKEPGKSCHMLRHTCGTLLYSETKDLQVVKQVLRHRNIEMTSRYSHIQDGLLKRYTSAIPIKPEGDD